VTPALGSILNGYRLIAPIGAGGMGAVFRAAPLNGGPDVALKLILINQDEPALRLRFEREAQAAARVDRHPGVVGVHSFDALSNPPSIVFELVDGRSFDQILRDQDFPSDLQIITWLAAIAEALEHIHRCGVIHRDLKPANVILRHSDGQPLIADFGLARQRDLQTLTRSGELLGTPTHMAPEQLNGQPVGPATDVWALAVMSHQLLSGGQLPFPGSTLTELAMGILRQPPRSLHKERPDLPPEVDAALRSALAKDPAKRPSPRAFVSSLAKALEAPAPGARPLRVLLPAILLVCFITAGILRRREGAARKERERSWRTQLRTAVRKLDKKTARITGELPRHILAHLISAALIEKHPPNFMCRSARNYLEPASRLMAASTTPPSPELKPGTKLRSVSKTLGAARSLELGAPGPIKDALKSLRAGQQNAPDRIARIAPQWRPNRHATALLLAIRRRQWHTALDQLKSFGAKPGRDLEALRTRAQSELFVERLFDPKAPANQLLELAAAARSSNQGKVLQALVLKRLRQTHSLPLSSTAWLRLERHPSLIRPLPPVPARIAIFLAERAWAGRPALHLNAARRLTAAFRNEPDAFTGQVIPSEVLLNLRGATVLAGTNDRKQLTKELYELLADAIRGGLYIPFQHLQWAVDFQQDKLLDPRVKASKAAYPRFIRGFLPDESARSGGAQAFIAHLKQRVADLKAALATNELVPAYSSSAKLELGRLALRIADLEQTDPKPTLKAALARIEGIMSSSPEPDQVAYRRYEWTATLRHYWDQALLNKAEALLLDRYQKTQRNELGLGRPPGQPLSILTEQRFKKLSAFFAAARAEESKSRGDLSGALKFWRQALQMYPRATALQDGYGRELLSQGMLNKAREFLQELIKSGLAEGSSLPEAIRKAEEKP